MLIVDDRSADATARIVSETAQEWDRLSLHSITDCPPGLGGKQNALAEGIAHTASDVIAMTDADCEPAPEWLAGIAGAFSAGVGVVAGTAVLRPTGGLWKYLQQLDLAHLLASAQGFVGLGAPYSAIGNNLAVRRSAYEEIGGYRAAPGGQQSGREHNTAAAAGRSTEGIAAAQGMVTRKAAPVVR